MRSLMRRTAVVAGAVVVMLSLAMGVAAADAVPPVGGPPPTRTFHSPFDAYIANYGPGTVRVVNTATSTITTTIPVGTKPYGVAVTADGGHAYVTNSGSNTVSAIDTATNTVTSTVLVGTTPLGVAVTTDGGHVYVTNNKSNSVSVIDTATNAVTATIPVGMGPWGVAISPDGKRVYVTNTLSDTVSVIDTATNAVTATIRGFSAPWGVAAAPDGSHVYVTNALSDTVSVIDTVTNKVATIHVGSFPYGVAITPGGRYAYVTNALSNTVSMIHTVTNAVVATVHVGDRPHSIAIAPDGSQAYVTNTFSDTVSAIDTATRKVATIHRFNKPEGVAGPSAVVPKVLAGYADTILTRGSYPHPWRGTRHVLFRGCNYFTPRSRPRFLSVCGRYDGGALMLDNPTSHPMTVANASIRIGSRRFHPWPGLRVTVPGHERLILTQTGRIRGDFNFNGSETNHTLTRCTNDKLVPIFHVTVDGQALNYRDIHQILNTGGTDPGRPRCGSRNEMRNWGPVTLSSP